MEEEGGKEYNQERVQSCPLQSFPTLYFVNFARAKHSEGESDDFETWAWARIREKVLHGVIFTTYHHTLMTWGSCAFEGYATRAKVTPHSPTSLKIIKRATSP